MTRSRLHYRVLPSILSIALLFLSPGRTVEIAELTPEQKDVLSLLEFRENALESYQGFRDRLDQKLPLTGAQLRELHTAVVEEKPLLDRMISFVNSNDSILNQAPEKLSPTDRLHYISVLGMSMALADTYLQTISQYHEDKDLRRILNEGGSTYGKPKNFLKKCIKTLLKRKHVKRYANGATQYLLDDTVLHAVGAEVGQASFWKAIVDNSYLLALVSENTSAEEENAVLSESESEDGASMDGEDAESEVVVETPSQKLRHKIIQTLRYKRTGLKDFFFKTKMGVFGALSKFFGNTVGMVQFRKGKLHHNKAFITDVQSLLKPMDILQERTPFRLTDFFIPGYFGHAAIWIGTERELRDLGIWDHPLIVKLHDKIRAGASIVEALRPGTQANTVDHFSDIDDFALLRLKEPLQGEELKRAILATAQQYEKKYDFNFDVATQRTLVCSEMMYIAFTQVNWRTEKSMGRFTINPDAIAEQGTPGGALDVIALYTAGVKQTGDLSVKMKYILDHAKQKDSQILKGLNSL